MITLLNSRAHLTSAANPRRETNHRPASAIFTPVPGPFAPDSSHAAPKIVAAY
jgi:hypothetical protein